METANHWPALVAPPPDGEQDDAGPPAILAERLGKARGAQQPPLSRLSFCIARGEFLGLIGPPGAGKSALLRMLATLSVPDAGRLLLLGDDTRTHAPLIRRSLGYMSQTGGIDPVLTAEEHVRLAAHLHGLGRRESARRAAEVLVQLDLGGVARQKAGTLSPGGKKRLALACALAGRPRLLVLDDPTGDVPPRERQAIWAAVRGVHETERTTIVLATHQLEEAEAICQRVGILDGGRLITLGSPSELQAQVTGVTVTLHLAAGADSTAAALLLERLAGVQAVVPRAGLIEARATSAHTLPSMLRLLEEHEIAVRHAMLSKPSLDEVFFRHTGRTIRDAQPLRIVRTGAPGPR